MLFFSSLADDSLKYFSKGTNLNPTMVSCKSWYMFSDKHKPLPNELWVNIWLRCSNQDKRARKILVSSLVHQEKKSHLLTLRLPGSFNIKNNLPSTKDNQIGEEKHPSTNTLKCTHIHACAFIFYSFTRKKVLPFLSMAFSDHLST